MCAMYESDMEAQRLSFRSTAVAKRMAMAQRQSQSVKHVCAARAQSRDLNNCALNTKARVSTDNCSEFTKRGRVKEENCVFVR